MAKLFLSYSRKDAPLAKRFTRWLEQRGHDGWRDEDNIRGGAKCLVRNRKGAARLRRGTRPLVGTFGAIALGTRRSRLWPRRWKSCRPALYAFRRTAWANSILENERKMAGLLQDGQKLPYDCKAAAQKDGA